MAHKKQQRKDPQIVIEGIEDVLEMDLAKNKGIVVQAEVELDAFRIAREHEKRKKSHWSTLIGGEKYNDTSLGQAVKQCEINMRHLSDKMKLARERIAHHSEIVQRLEAELKNQYKGLKALKEQRQNGTAS